MCEQCNSGIAHFDRHDTQAALSCRNITHLVWYSACANCEIPAVRNSNPWQMISQGNSSGSVAIRQGVCVTVGPFGFCVDSSQPHTLIQWRTWLWSYRNPFWIIILMLSPEGWVAELTLTFSKSRRQLFHSLAYRPQLKSMWIAFATHLPLSSVMWHIYEWSRIFNKKIIISSTGNWLVKSGNEKEKSFQRKSKLNMFIFTWIFHQSINFTTGSNDNLIQWLIK